MHDMLIFTVNAKVFIIFPRNNMNFVCAFKIVKHIKDFFTIIECIV